MIVGVDAVYYNVQEMRRAVAFYRDVLGLRLVEDGDDWSAFDVDGVRVGLHDNYGKPVQRGGAVLTLRSTDIRADVEQLQAKGVKFHGKISDQPWGSLISFEDSEGNALDLMQRPA